MLLQTCLQTYVQPYVVTSKITKQLSHSLFFWGWEVPLGGGWVWLEWLEHGVASLTGSYSMAVRPFEEQIYRPLRSSHMEYTGNGIQNWFLKEIILFTYYVKAPLRGLLKEIPENHLFHLGLETPACVLHMTQLSRLKQQNWKELYIRFQLTVSILYKSFFLLFSYGLQPTIIWLSHVRWSVHPSVRPSGNVLMLRHVHAYLYVGPAKDLVMGLSAHDQTFAFRVGLVEIIGQC